MTLPEEFVEALAEDANDALNTADRQRLAEYLFTWLSTVTRKKPVADLPERLEQMRKRFVSLADSVTLRVGYSTVTVTAAGDAEATLRQLELGTNWFAAYEGNVREQLAAVLLLR